MSNPFNVAKEGSVASRFVTASDPQETKAAEEYDPRSLFERLQAQKTAKQDKFEETWKLSNQFRGIDEGESEFLAGVARDRREELRKKREEESKELEEFRRAREVSPPPTLGSHSLSPPPVKAVASPPLPSSKASSPPLKPSKSSATPLGPGAGIGAGAAAAAAKAKRKRDGSALLGIKKKTGPPAASTKAISSSPASRETTTATATATAMAKGDGVTAPAKKAKTER